MVSLDHADKLSALLCYGRSNNVVEVGYRPTADGAAIDRRVEPDAAARPLDDEQLANLDLNLNAKQATKLEQRWLHVLGLTVDELPVHARPVSSSERPLFLSALTVAVPQRNEQRIAFVFFLDERALNPEADDG